MNSNFLNNSHLTSMIGSNIQSDQFNKSGTGSSFYQGVDFDEVNGVNIFPFKL